MMSRLSGHTDSATFADQLEHHCVAEWSAAMRTCLLGIDSPNGLMTCDAQTMDAECERAFGRLGELAESAGKSDPSLADKKEAFLHSCSTLSSAARKCLAEAEHLRDFKACPDTELVAHAVASDALGWLPAPIPGLTHWHVERVPSRMDDSSTIIATRLARETVRATSREQRPALIIRCADGSLDLYINVAMQVAHDTPNETATRIRIDDDKAVEWSGAPSTSGDAIFLSSPGKLVSRLRGKRRLLFEFTPAGRSPTDVEFSIEGIDEVFGQLAGCGLTATR